MEILIQTCLMPLAIKTQNDSFKFIHELKQEMHADLKYVETLEKEINELESDKAEFSSMYDVILQECMSNDVKCSYLQSLSDLDALAELQCMYLHKVKDCDCLAQKLLKQTESVSKKTSSKNLSKLLESQITDKTGLGYDNQVFHSHVFDCDELSSFESDDSVPTSLVNDRFKSGKGYHVVPPPYTGTFMPSKLNLVLHDAPTASETVLNVFNVEPSITKPTKDMSQSNKPYAPIIKDWVSDSEDESEGEHMPTQKAPSFVQTSEHVKTPRTSVKPGNPQQALKDKGVIDSGCSRHMTGNISYLFNFEEINGGYVAFGGNPKGGNITGK
nr:ribonuclease H-like domain-containing protein [Tanacetum cinerariifolium]